VASAIRIDPDHRRCVAFFERAVEPLVIAQLVLVGRPAASATARELLVRSVCIRDRHDAIAALSQSPILVRVSTFRSKRARPARTPGDDGQVWVWASD
jgi:hypothetical protein